MRIAAAFSVLGGYLILLRVILYYDDDTILLYDIMPRARSLAHHCWTLE